MSANNNEIVQLDITTYKKLLASHNILTKQRRKGHDRVKKFRGKKISSNSLSDSDSDPYSLPLATPLELPAFISQESSQVSSHQLDENLEADLTRLKEEGFIISDYNCNLDHFLRAFAIMLARPSKINLKLDHLVVGKQIQWKMSNNNMNLTIEEAVKGYLPNLFLIIDEYFKSYKDQKHYNGIKVTMNVNEKKEVQECAPQMPHCDVSTPLYVFIILSVADECLATEVYGKRTELEEIDNQNQFQSFFKEKNIQIKRGQAMVLLPYFVHGAPQIAKKLRTLLFLEYSSRRLKDDTYKQTFVQDFKIKKKFKTEINRIKATIGWEDAPEEQTSSKKQKKV